MHFFDGVTGIKDFDLWCFFEKFGNAAFPHRWRGNADFGLSSHGRWPGDPDAFTGRRIDLMGRSIPIAEGDELDGIRRWLKDNRDRTNTPGLLAKKCLVGIWPERFIGQSVWRETTQKS